MYVVLQSQQIPADQLLTSTVSSLMGEMVASALAQEGVSRLSSFISTMLDDRVSRAHMLARLERALHHLEFEDCKDANHIRLAVAAPLQEDAQERLHGGRGPPQQAQAAGAGRPGGGRAAGNESLFP